MRDVLGKARGVNVEAHSPDLHLVGQRAHVLRIAAVDQVKEVEVLRLVRDDVVLQVGGGALEVAILVNQIAAKAPVADEERGAVLRFAGSLARWAVLQRCHVAAASAVRHHTVVVQCPATAVAALKFNLRR